MKKKTSSKTKSRPRLSKAEANDLFNRADAAEERGEFSSAFRLFLRGAKSGHTWAMKGLSSLYTAGRGVKQDLDKALEWDLRAYRKGDKDTAFNIALDMRFLCRHDEFLKWLDRSSRAGHAGAHLEIALYCMSQDNPVQARKFARKAFLTTNPAKASQLDRERAYYLLHGLESVGKPETKRHPLFKDYREWERKRQRRVKKLSK